MNGIKWSKSEKSIARQAFDKAYQVECQHLIKKLKEKTAKLEKPEDIWELQNYLDKREKEMAQKYDYRYSILVLVFAQLLKQGWIEINDLNGLDAEKIKQIESLVSYNSRSHGCAEQGA